LRGPLLPKLRGQFAEFLNEGSLVRLGGVPPTHLSRFAVRAPPDSPDCFSRLVCEAPCSWVAPPARDPRKLTEANSRLPRGSSNATRARIPASQPVHRREVVSDYQPIVHRLRRDAYGLGPTNPTRMFLPSETLGLRRTRFSRALSLLIPAFALRL